MTTQTWKIGDCLDLMQELDDDRVGLAIVDPPYYRINDSAWDRQWKSFDEYLDWIEQVALEIKRVLKPNGSMYVFGDDERIAYIQVRLDKHFSFLNHLIWYKRNNQSIKGAANSRRYAVVSERILFYSLQDSTGLTAIHEDVNCFLPIKEYMRGEYDKVMQANGFTTKDECNQYLNDITETASVVSRHYFSDSQWIFPTFELYGKLRKTGFFVRNYEDLRRNYEDLRRNYEDLRRVFNPRPGMYEVFDIPIIGGGENTPHPTQKPMALIKQLILNSTNEGDLVLDPFLGSGTTLEACMQTNRNCIGFDVSDEWKPHYKKRLRQNDAKLNSWFKE